MANHITNNHVDITGAKAGDFLKWNDLTKKFVPGRNTGSGENVVNTIAERDAISGTLLIGEGVLVADATGDTTVDAGYAYYKWSGTAFIKVAEGESLDVVIEMNNEAYDYAIWNADLTGGASRQAIANKIKELDDTILELSPAKADSLAGKDLSYSSTYSGFLPSGLATQWYPDNLVPGTQINNVLRTAPNYLFTIPQFRSGVKNKPEKYGVLSVSYASSTHAFSPLPTRLPLTDNIATTPLGQNVSASGAVAPHNNFWAHANINLSVTDTVITGRVNFQVSHTEAGTSNKSRFFLDDSTAASINGVSVTIQTKNSKYLSGREMLGRNTVLSVNYNADNLFERLYLTNNNTTIDCTASSGASASPTSVPVFTDAFPVANKAVVLNQSNQASNSPLVRINAHKPGHGVVSTTYDILAGLGFKVNTYDTVSNTTQEYFQDETQRFYAGTKTAFDSSVVLPDGEAQVSSGLLRFNTDYTRALTVQRYDRKFSSVSSLSSGTFNINSFDTASVFPHGTGAVNIILYTDSSIPDNRRYFDMGIPFGQGGDGSTMATAIGCRVTNSGNTIAYTFGTYSTASSNREFITSIFFRDNTQVMTSILTS